MRSWVSLLAVLLVTCLSFSVPLAIAVGPEEASGKISDADRSLRDAFHTAMDAEAGGANVSELMVRLNEAGDALTSAKVALAVENYSSAVNLANTCKGLADGVSGDAEILRGDAMARSVDWWLVVSFSAVGSAVFAASLFLIWRWFRRVYERRALQSRPEVAA